MSTPHRRHEFICKIGADEKHGLADELRSLAMRLERGEISAGCVGGCTVGSLYVYREDPDMTHDEYFRQLNADLEKGLPA